MTAPIFSADVERFRALVAERTGLHFDESRRDLLAEVLRRRLEATDISEPASYFSRLQSSALARDEVRALAAEVTVAETYFFRYAEHWQAFRETVLPSAIAARAPARSLRLLSAGCASGEEAYSLAALVSERRTDLLDGWRISIRAVDVNPAMLERAVRARFSSWSLRETSPDLRARIFRPDGREFQLVEEVRALVSFEERNLAEEDAELWPPDAWDVVFCRNVLMYFEPEAARRLIARIARALAPGGFLFLGHAETLRGLSHEFHLRHTHGTFYYQRRLEGEAPAVAATVCPMAAPTPTVSGFSRAVDECGSWVEAIQRATERIAALSRDSSPPPVAVGAPPAAAIHARRDLALAFDLLRQERFGEAVEIVRALPLESQSDPDARLLHAVLLTQLGRLVEAERLCERLLASDELNAGAHYVMALCREHAQDRPGAAEHDQAAAYLDGGFAMPHLHQGLMARRVGDRETAARELAQALALLDREDPARLLLFGGGFSREALQALCRAELRACGGSS